MKQNVERFRLHRAGVLNVWQYDDQVFEAAGGRMLLRGANGAGKSKTLEMLLPFVLDGDKARLTASHRHHTSLLWLMLDGYEGASRTGYLWVEFAQPDGRTMTCGIGIRASQSARQATAWYFTSPRRVGVDLLLEDDGGPLSRDRCRAQVETDGHFFDSPRSYKEHVGQSLFGLTSTRYDELLRLLYWLRQPQVGEDIEPARLAAQLQQALPQVDDAAVRAAGATFDELEAFGEGIDRRDRAATAVADFGEVYTSYARGVVRERTDAVMAAVRERRRLARAAGTSTATHERAQRELLGLRAQLTETTSALDALRARRTELAQSPEARSQRTLLDLQERSAELDTAADRAARAAGSVRNRADQSAQRLASDSADLVQHVQQRHHAWSALSAELLGAGARRPLDLRAALRTVQLGVRSDCDALTTDIDSVGSALVAGQVELTRLLGELTVVDSARREHAAAAAELSEHERREVEAEQRTERAQSLADAAETRAQEQEAALLAALQDWREHSGAVAFDLAELTADALAGLSRTARAAATPVLARHAAELASAGAERASAERATDALATRRAAVQAEADPSPEPPSWGRSDRSTEPGAPLWRLVDFGPGVSPQRRAAAEAALEASGLLDAWIRPDGSVLRGERDDIVLVAGAADVAGRTLRDVLIAERDAAVPAQVVEAVLGQIAWHDRDTDPDAAADADAVNEAALWSDGRWRLGPVQGRNSKARPQFVGASARAAERERRLVELDALLADTRLRVASATQRVEAANSARQVIEDWLAVVPAHEPLITAWAGSTEAARTAALERAALTDQVHATAVVRRRVAGLWDALRDLAARHDLPTDEQGLQARSERLRQLTRQLDGQVAGLPHTIDRLRRWGRDHEGWVTESADAEGLERTASEARGLAVSTRARLDELRDSVGASVEQLQRRLAQVDREVSDTEARSGELGQLVERGIGAEAEARTRLEQAQRALSAAEPAENAASSAMGRLVEADGLLESVVGDWLTGERLSATREGDAGIARELADLVGELRTVDQNAVLAAAHHLQTGPAATVEPRVLTVDGVLVAVGHDEGGERSLVDLGRRLRVSVDEDRALLTDRERTLFEDHVLGQLGESLRQRRIEADELVRAMNDLLSSVTTSQGIQVRLRWRQREDIPADAVRAVRLLGQPVSALLPDERRELREALHRLIEVSRSEQPELSYAEHLSRALDYRQWFGFTIRYRRPESPDTWLDLHRRSPLSQGEQKVLCYLPLFAAAAAHFSSLAGAAPDAPRLVLLDDAFPKIDARTHPLLFGLLVDLDLDFVITSERLWGDHSTVPSLSIYEALRDPMQRGIAQYQHRWDGQRLEAVGA